MSYIKFHPISKTHGYAVEKVQKSYNVVFVRKGVDSSGQEILIKEANSRSNGILHSYPSPFIADHVIRKEILPLYKKGA